ncbi:MAG: hypothetical protein WD401_05310 [Thermomicrobiaceae bacterium]
MPPEIFLPLSIICAGTVFVRYLRIRRIAAGIGWVLLILALGGFGSGLAESFTWSGFVFLFVAAAGLMIVVQEAIVRRRVRRNRQQNQRVNLNHRS